MDFQNPDTFLLRARVSSMTNAKAIDGGGACGVILIPPKLGPYSRKSVPSKQAGNTAYKSNQLHQAWDAYTECLNLEPGNSVMNAKLYSNRAAVLQKGKVQRR